MKCSAFNFGLQIVVVTTQMDQVNYKKCNYEISILLI